MKKELLSCETKSFNLYEIKTLSRETQSFNLYLDNEVAEFPS